MASAEITMEICDRCREDKRGADIQAGVAEYGCAECLRMEGGRNREKRKRCEKVVGGGW